MYYKKEPVKLQLFTPHAKQWEIIQALERKDIMYCTVVCGRQFGKSMLAMNVAIHWATSNNNVRVFWVSPTAPQLETVYKQILAAINDTGLVKKSKATKGTTEINFVNGSVIDFRSAASEDNLRGTSVHYMILDECAFMRKETVEKILLPMLTVTGRKVLCCTTPKGRNFIYDWFKKGQTKNPIHRRWVSFQYSSYDNPGADRVYLEEQKALLPDNEFRQEFLAEFTDKFGIFENIDELCCLPVQNEPLDEAYFAGIDIGLIGDATVLAIVNGEGNLVKYYRWENIESPNLIKKIIDINSKWKFKRILIENNNQGLPIYQDLRKHINNINDIHTSTKTKPDLINQLVHLFKMKEIKLVKEKKDPYLKNELLSFMYYNRPGGYVKYQAADGCNDDCVMALAIAIECYSRNKFDSRYIGFY